jgi:hypothetical protein
MTRLRLSGATGSSLTTLQLLPIVGSERGNIAQARRSYYPITS